METKFQLNVGIIALGFLVAMNVAAEPRTVDVTIDSMRPYASGDYFVNVSSNQLTGPDTNQMSTTCTKTYVVQKDSAGAKSVIASLLTAYALDGTVQIEIPSSTGCVGYATPIQSVFLK